MKLVATRKTFHFEDASGYAFDVVAEQGPSGAWSAAVTMRTCGFGTAEKAVAHLTSSAKAFTRQVEEQE